MKKDRKDLAESSENFAFDVIPYKRDQDLVKVGLFVKDQREVPWYGKGADGLNQKKLEIM